MEQPGFLDESRHPVDNIWVGSFGRNNSSEDSLIGIEAENKDGDIVDVM